MGMGGGGGGSIPPAGLTPLQKENFSQGQQLYDSYFNQAAPLAKQARGLAQGGLLNWGMTQVNKGLQAPDMAPGMVARNAARYGIAPDPTVVNAMAEDSALRRASSGVAMQNAARRGLAEAQYDMRFGGLA